MTVSRALNRNGYVNPDVRDRVLASASRLNYRPNVLARSLRQQSTKAVGVLLPDIANPFSPELVQGIESVLLDNGYDCILTASLRNGEREKSALTAFLDHRVDGILVATRETRAGNEALVEAVKRGTQVGTIGRLLNHDRVDHVTADHWRGAFDMVAHLIALGDKKIGFLGASIVMGPKGESPKYSTQEDGHEGMVRLLTPRSRPTAEQGRIAGQMLVERLTHQYEGLLRDQVLPCKLIVRKSCGATS